LGAHASCYNPLRLLHLLAALLAGLALLQACAAPDPREDLVLLDDAAERNRRSVWLVFQASVRDREPRASLVVREDGAVSGKSVGGEGDAGSAGNLRLPGRSPMKPAAAEGRLTADDPPDPAFRKTLLQLRYDLYFISKRILQGRWE